MGSVQRVLTWVSRGLIWMGVGVCGCWGGASGDARCCVSTVMVEEGLCGVMRWVSGL